MNLPPTGVTDPHIRIFNDRPYLYASHDHAPESTRFDMRDWQVWTSEDLVDWTLASTLKPEETYIGKPIDGCWATDAIEHDGRYYWFFSEVVPAEDRRQVGVVRSDTPTGPWEDTLQGPLLRHDLVPTEVYDPCAFKAEDGSVYILFGVWDYYIARLRDDMRGLAEEPRKIVIHHPEGPYGKGKTDDKVFLHQRGNLYYLSWGCYYATSRHLYGPYECQGCFVEPGRIDPTMRAPTWPHGPTQGRHGAFFDWQGQSYFTYCDMSQSGNRYFRSSWISYLHYRADGTIDPIRIGPEAVGHYDATTGPIPAVNFFSCDGFWKEHTDKSAFFLRPVSDHATVTFPKIDTGDGGPRQLILTLGGTVSEGTVGVHRGHASGPILGSASLPKEEFASPSGEIVIDLPAVRAREDLCLVFRGRPLNGLTFHALSLQ